MRKINMQMNQVSPSKGKKLQCQGDDVFANIFIPSTKTYKEIKKEQEEEAERAKKHQEKEERKINRVVEKSRGMAPLLDAVPEREWHFA